jgi:hypothetical protein
MKNLLAFGLAVALSAPASAQLKPYTDYTVSDSVSNVSTIKVKENMVEDYLQGIRNTWVASNAVATAWADERLPCLRERSAQQR